MAPVTDHLKGLTPRQRRFVQEYVRRKGNAAAAARAAGYSPDNARSQGYQNATKRDIQAAIEAELEASGANKTAVMATLGAQMHASILPFEPWLRGEKTLEELAAEGVDVSVVKSATVRPGPHGETRRIQLHDAQAAAAQVGRILGMTADGPREGQPVGFILTDFRSMSDEELKRYARAVAPDDAFAGCGPRTAAK